MQGDNLAGALVSLVRDLEPGLALLVSVVCYLLGLLAFFQGAARLLKASEDKFHAPSAAGTALSFLVCAVMVAFPSWLAGAGESLFGTGRTAAHASLGYGGRGVDYDALLGAVFAIVAWVGLFAFLRGVFVLRAAADGAPGATAARAFLHMLGGAAAWHMTGVIEAVQTTLGIRVLTIT